MVAEYLAEPWGSYTSAPRQHVLILLVGFLCAQSATIFLTSEGFIAKFDENLQTPIFQMSLAFACAFVASSAYIFSLGGGASALLSFVKMQGSQIVFLAVTTFGALNSYYAAALVMSEPNLSLAILILPLLMPIVAVCFERERDGPVRQYGLWPCCFKNRSNPYYGVYPGLLLIVIACVLAFGRTGTLCTSIGIAFAMIALLLETAALGAAAVILGRDKPELHTPYLLAWWVSLIAIPLLLLSSLPFGEGSRVVAFAEARGGTAYLIHASVALVGAAALMLRYALIHAASALTTSIVVACSLALSGFTVLCLHLPGPAPYNYAGLLLLPACVYAHIYYMRERERYAPRSDAESGKAPLQPTTEMSPLAPPKADAKSSTGNPGACLIA